MSKIYNTLCLVACLSIFLSFNLSAQNLLINPDFETGLMAPWIAGNGNTVTIEEDAQNGNWAAHGNIEQFVDLVEGVNYTWTGYAKCLGNCDLNMWIGLKDQVNTGNPAVNFNFKEFSDYGLCTIEFTALSTGSHKFWVWGQGESDYISDNFILLAEGTSGVYNLSGDHTLEITNQLDAVTLAIDAEFSEASVNIFDMTGKLVHSLTTSDVTTRFSQETFPVAGTYVFQVKIGKHVIAKQVAILK